MDPCPRPPLPPHSRGSTEQIITQTRMWAQRPHPHLASCARGTSAGARASAESAVAWQLPRNTAAGSRCSHGGGSTEKLYTADRPASERPSMLSAWPKCGSMDGKGYQEVMFLAYVSFEPESQAGRQADSQADRVWQADRHTETGRQAGGEAQPDKRTDRQRGRGGYNWRHWRGMSAPLPPLPPLLLGHTRSSARRWQRRQKKNA
eukprot:143176-Chlamydomonas_euryale.AAC.1